MTDRLKLNREIVDELAKKILDHPFPSAASLVTFGHYGCPVVIAELLRYIRELHQRLDACGRSP